MPHYETASLSEDRSKKVRAERAVNRRRKQGNLSVAIAKHLRNITAADGVMTVRDRDSLDRATAAQAAEARRKARTDALLLRLFPERPKD
jgi:stress response protein YsnF